MHNEITNLYCFGDCKNNNQNEYDKRMLYTVGTNEQRAHTLSY